jgi:hypothetical protein
VLYVSKPGQYKLEVLRVSSMQCGLSLDSAQTRQYTKT